EVRIAAGGVVLGVDVANLGFSDASLVELMLQADGHDAFLGASTEGHGQVRHLRIVVVSLVVDVLEKQVIVLGKRGSGEQAAVDVVVIGVLQHAIGIPGGSGAGGRD